MANQSTYKTEQDQIDAFWDRVDKSGGQGSCWEWQAYRDTRGYGVVGWGGKARKAHRVAYTLEYEESIGNLFVLHKCDNPPCCNPSHLFLGTQKDNMRDMARKRRSGREKRRGENNGRSKLTAQQVIAIRQRYAEGNITQRKLASLYGVGEYAIFAIVSLKHWSHIESNYEYIRGNANGENNGSAKLTDEAVREIRKLYNAGKITQADLANQYGVSKGAIANIIQGISWRHLLP